MEDTMMTRRWNQFIDLINDSRPVTELEPPIQNERERQIFNNMVDELARARKVNPKAALVKCIDRCNNITTMSWALSRDRIYRMIKETEMYFPELISVLKE